MLDGAVQTIQCYIDRYLFEPGSYWAEDYFAERSYSRWAAFEIQERLIEEITRLPPHITGREPLSIVEIILNFKRSLERCANVRDDKTSNLMFSAALTTTEEILNLF